MGYTYASLVGSPIQVSSGTKTITMDPAVIGACSVLLMVSTPPVSSPYNSYFQVIAYIGASATKTDITVGAGTYLLIKLPNGVFTPSAEIAAVAAGSGSGGPPGGVGPT